MNTDPAPYGTRGAAFSAGVLNEYELNESGLALLAEACRVLDVIDTLEATLRASGPVARGSTGQVVIHPVVPEIRQQRALLARLLRDLDLPVDEAEEDDERDAPAVPNVNRERASYASRERWRRARTVGS